MCAASRVVLVLAGIALSGPPAVAQDFGIPAPLGSGHDRERQPTLATDGTGNWVGVAAIALLMALGRSFAFRAGAQTRPASTCQE